MKVSELIAALQFMPQDLMVTVRYALVPMELIEEILFLLDASDSRLYDTTKATEELRKFTEARA